jgi:ribosome biogenesis GTPase
MRSGSIIQGRGGLYTVREDGGETFVLRAKKKFRYEKITPLVGDRVSFTPGNLEEHGWMEEILPRLSVSVRPPVANISQLIITLAPEPQADLLLVDKLLIFAFRQGITPLLVVNKSDLAPHLYEEVQAAYAPAGVKVLSLSGKTCEGVQALADEMAGHLNCFAGQSGTGKSTLISKLTGLELETGEISQRIHRGKQTTRHITLIEAEGLRVLDTPGFSLLELPDKLEPSQVRDYYPEFASMSAKCRFDPCLHDQEPDCAISQGAKTGIPHPERLLRYRSLLQQTREKWGKRYD